MNKIVPLITISWVLASANAQPAQPAPQKPQQAKKTESLLQRVLRITGISVTPRELRGGPQDAPAPGDIWLAAASGADLPREITSSGGYRSPIFDSKGEAVFVLKEGELFKVSLRDSEVRRLEAPIGLSKLVGLDPDGMLLVLGKDHRIGLLSTKSGKIEYLAYDPSSKEDATLLEHLKAWTRVYGELTLSVAAQGSSIRNGWTDVVLKWADGEPVNISRCQGSNCSQPSLSGDQKQVVFIKTAKKRPGS